MSLYEQAIAAERAAKIARDMLDHEAGIEQIKAENARLREELAALNAEVERKMSAAAFLLKQPAQEPCRANPYYSGPSCCDKGTVGCTVPSHRADRQPTPDAMKGGK